jgi:hypothetical protein
LIYDYVLPEKRADSLAICQSVAGVIGFVSTLLISPLITAIQNNGNHFLGMAIYAQQITSFLGLLFTLIAVFYVRYVLIMRKKEA